MRQITFLLISLLLAGCSTQSHWAFDEIRTGDALFDSTKITCSAKNSMRGIDIELLKTEEKIRVFLNVHSLPLPPLPHNPKAASAKLLIGEESFDFEAYRFEGGQRLLLPDEATPLIVAALKENKEIMIQLVGYRDSIDSTGFANKYKQLIHPFPFPNLIQPPY